MHIREYDIVYNRKDDRQCNPGQPAYGEFLPFSISGIFNLHTCSAASQRMIHRTFIESGAIGIESRCTTTELRERVGTTLQVFHVVRGHESGSPCNHYTSSSIVSKLPTIGS